MGLKVQPTLSICSEEASQPQGGFGGNGPFAGTDLVNPALRDSNGLGQSIPGDVERFQKILQEDFAGMNRGKVAGFHGLVSFSGNLLNLILSVPEPV